MATQWNGAALVQSFGKFCMAGHRPASPSHHPPDTDTQTHRRRLPRQACQMYVPWNVDDSTCGGEGPAPDCLGAHACVYLWNVDESTAQFLTVSTIQPPPPPTHTHTLSLFLLCSTTGIETTSYTTGREEGDHRLWAFGRRWSAPPTASNLRWWLVVSDHTRAKNKDCIFIRHDPVPLQQDSIHYPSNSIHSKRTILLFLVLHHCSENGLNRVLLWASQLRTHTGAPHST